MAMSTHPFITPRRLLLLTVLIVAAALGAALYYQHVAGLVPCPLCVVQRAAFAAAGLLALAGLLLPWPRAVAALALLPTLAGAGVAAWHSWLVAYPPESMTCGRPFQWFNDDFPLATWLPKIFRGEGDCLSDSWSLAGLNMPQWSLVMFVVLAVVLLLALRREARPRRGRR
jgi:disulfide bond formation protein DsbB